MSNRENKINYTKIETLPHSKPEVIFHEIAKINKEDLSKETLKKTEKDDRAFIASILKKAIINTSIKKRKIS